ncbi:MAG TPA: hypothetical protein VE175_07665 [Woeseiaceae bacterium]|jgi:hypothetical protein|nr:hypothetical protein [Woeseiaceae bacterium]
MQKLLASCGLLFSLSLVAGCVVTTPGLGEETGTTTLPSGSTLLDSDEDECDGTVQVAEGSIEDDDELIDDDDDFDDEGLDETAFVQPGENATFELEDDDEDIEWACVGEESPDVETTSCPEGTTHVRITRASEGDNVLIECFG